MFATREQPKRSRYLTKKKRVRWFYTHVLRRFWIRSYNSRRRDFTVRNKTASCHIVVCHLIFLFACQWWTFNNRHTLHPWHCCMYYRSNVRFYGSLVCNPCNWRLYFLYFLIWLFFHAPPLWSQIQVDLPRTNPDMPFFQQKEIQKVMERVLYIWAIRHPASSYVQGMNDLLTPLLLVAMHPHAHDVLRCDVATLDTQVSRLGS